MKTNKDGLVEIKLLCDYPGVGKKGDVVYLDPKRAQLVENLKKDSKKNKKEPSVTQSFRLSVVEKEKED